MGVHRLLSAGILQPRRLQLRRLDCPRLDSGLRAPRVRGPVRTRPRSLLRRQLRLQRHPPLPAAPPAAPRARPPPADPFAGTPFAGTTPLELQELALIRQALQDPERAGGIRQAYIGGVPTPPPAAPPAATTPPPAAPVGFVPKPMPEEILPGSHEAEMWDMAQEHERQLAEIRQGIQQQNQQTEIDNRRSAAAAAVTEFRAKYGHALADSDIQWIAQTAGYQNLPEAFDNADASAGRTVNFKANMTKALEFQLRSTDVLLNKILGGGAPAPAPAAGVPAPRRSPRVRWPRSLLLARRQRRMLASGI